MNEKLFSDFCVFAKAHVESGDIDPTYPVLKRIYEMRSYSLEQRLWFTLLYVTWYALDSAQQVFDRYPEPQLIDESLRLPTGTERRGFRGNALGPKTVNQIVRSVRGAYSSLFAWVEASTRGGGEDGWARLRRQFQEQPYCGSWASFKWADLLKNVHDYPITADNIGVGGGSLTAGPIPGMVRITGAKPLQCAQDVWRQKQLLQLAQQRGVPFSGLDQLETSLCDFNSLCKGHYYVGHDIDVQAEQFKRKRLNADWWAARAKAFPPRYLGELQGWDGVRKELKTRYRDKGEIIQ